MGFPAERAGQTTLIFGAAIVAWFARRKVSPTILTKVEPAQSLWGLGRFCVMMWIVFVG